MHDLVITNARICDGLGSAMVPGNLAVRDGRISALGDDLGSGRYAPILLLFNPLRVDRGPSRRVFDLPAGAPRLTTDAVGVLGVWVNGTRIVDENGARSDAPRPGRFLREFAC